MSINLHKAHDIVTGLHLAKGQAGYVHFASSRNVYTWSHMDGMYYIFQAKKATVEKYGKYSPYRVRDGYNLLLSFEDATCIEQVDMWQCVDIFSRERLFGGTVPVIDFADRKMV